MTGKSITSKRNRIKITDIKDFNELVKNEYNNKIELNLLCEEKFIKSVQDLLNIEEKISKEIYDSLKDGNVTYKCDDICDFIDYIKKINEFSDLHKSLCMKIKKIKKIHVDRIEYERIQSEQDDVSHMIYDIEKVKNEMSSLLKEEGKLKIELLQKEIEDAHCYTKDIELLKKITCSENNEVIEKYDSLNKIKSVYINVPENISDNYIKPCRGSVEYHYHISQNIPRMKRLINNMDKYIKYVEDDEIKVAYINQSEILQDTVNIAIAIYNGKEYKAVSGSNNIDGFLCAPSKNEEAFESSKVNKLGKLGIGYKRVNDSEKKIFEEIDKQIKLNYVKDEGSLYMYSKYEPCPSCYYVISQFSKKYPNIKIHIKYIKKYGAI